MPENDTLDPLFTALAELMIARGTRFADMSEQLKRAFIRAAIDSAEGKITDSHLSVLTGLQRRDVARLRAQDIKDPKPSPLTRLVALWLTLPNYSTHALPLRGDAPSFEALARQVRQDVHPRAMLDALEAAGTVQVTDSHVSLLERAYIPPVGSDAQLDYLAHNVGDHLRAATANSMGRTPPYTERALHYSDLTEDQATHLQERFKEGLMALLEDLSREASALKSEAPDRANTRIRLGGYGFDAESDPK